MTNLCFEQMASLLINDKTKVRMKILLSPVQDLNRLLYSELIYSDFDEYWFNEYLIKIIYEMASSKAKSF